MTRANDGLLREPNEDIFRWQKISIVQNKQVFRVGTDAILLASWIPHNINTCSRVLDVGTGTGVLALALKATYPSATVDAIDSNEEAVALATFNFSRFNNGHGLSVSLADLFEFRDSDRLYDLICCNPPYYYGHVRNPSPEKTRSRHLEVDIDQWMAGLTACCGAEGSICVIVPFDCAFNWIRAANRNGFYCVSRLDVYGVMGDLKPIRSLLHFNQQLGKLQTGSITIYGADKKMTEGYLSFTGIASQ